MLIARETEERMRCLPGRHPVGNWPQRQSRDAASNLEKLTLDTAETVDFGDYVKHGNSSGIFSRRPLSLSAYDAIRRALD
jgi:hypothetical protein